jgi:hypothetical protein
MAMIPVGPLTVEVTKTPRTQPQVASIKEITREKRRRAVRRELPEVMLKEFVDAINTACETGALPYKNLRLDQPGSPNKVHAHYMADTLDPVHEDTARRLMQRDKISFNEAMEYLTERLVDKRKSGCAFILTQDAKKFWYHVEKKQLYDNREVKGELSAEEKRMLEKLKKLVMTPGKEGDVLRELRK